MNLRDRLRTLEQGLDPQEAYRVIFVADGADQTAEIARYEPPRLSRRLQPLRGLEHEHREAVLT